MFEGLDHQKSVACCATRSSRITAYLKSLRLFNKYCRDDSIFRLAGYWGFQVTDSPDLVDTGIFLEGIIESLTR